MDNPNWAAYNAAQTEEKTRFVALLVDLCGTVPQTGRGRPRLTLSDMLFASVYKAYVGFSSRRFTSDLYDAYADGLIDSKPHFNSVSNYPSKPELTDVLRNLVTTSSLPLKAGLHKNYPFEGVVCAKLPQPYPGVRSRTGNFSRPHMDFRLTRPVELRFAVGTKYPGLGSARREKWSRNRTVV